jgi:hypothetical protein
LSVRRKRYRTGNAESRIPFRSGGQILIDALKVDGVDIVFCLAGESFFAGD